MYCKVISNDLLKLLTNNSPVKNDLHILRRIVDPETDTVTVYIITKYKNTEYKYEEDTETLLLSIDPNIKTIVIPRALEQQYPIGTRYYFGHFVRDVERKGLTDITGVVNIDQPYLITNDLPEYIPLTDFSYYYYFTYYDRSYLIIGDDSVKRADTPIWNVVRINSEDK